VKFDGDINRVAKLFANQTQRFDRAPELLCGNVVASGFFSDGIERPDFHGPNVAGQQLSREPGGLVIEVNPVVTGIVDPY